MKYRKSAEGGNNCVLWYLILGVNEDSSSNCFFLIRLIFLFICFCFFKWYILGKIDKLSINLWIFFIFSQAWEKKSRDFSFRNALFKRSWQERVFLKPETFMLFVIKGYQTCVAEDLGNLFLGFRCCGLTPGSTMYHAVAHSPSCPVHGEENQKKVNFVSQYKSSWIIEIK